MNKSYELSTLWTPLPSYPGYFINEFNCVKTRRTRLGQIQNITVEENEGKVRIGYGRKVEYIDIRDLRLDADKGKYPKKKFFTRVSGEGRSILDATRFHKLAERFTPDMHRHLTPDKDSLFRTTKDQLDMGIQICQDCGHPQPVEFRMCKNCNEVILFPER